MSFPDSFRIVPPPPTAHTAPPVLPHTSLSVATVGVVILLQVDPVKCRIIPFSPTANTLVAELPQTPRRLVFVPEVSVAQPVPLKRRIVPLEPTAITLLAPVPQTPNRSSVVPAFFVHVLPLYCSSAPPRPTTKRLVGLLPHTPSRKVESGADGSLTQFFAQPGAGRAWSTVGLRSRGALSCGDVSMGLLKSGSGPSTEASAPGPLSGLGPSDPRSRRLSRAGRPSRSPSTLAKSTTLAPASSTSKG